MVSLASKERIKRILRTEGLAPNRKMGQHFMVDPQLVSSIIEEAALSDDDFVVEIGPGLGSLTESLARKVRELLVIEKDQKLLSLLRQLLKDQDNIKYCCQDALDFDYASLFQGDRKGLQLVGNLPYYISSAILRRVLPFRTGWKSMTFMLQLEVARRLVAEPGSKEYGILTLAVDYYAETEIKMSVPAAAFYPRPEVDSALIRLIPRPRPPVEIIDEDFFFNIIRAAFQQRRKMLRNALAKNSLLQLKKDRVVAAMKAEGLNPRIRGERLSLSSFASLSNRLVVEREESATSD